jgi:spermidine/putrescine transport system permease protein
MVILGLVGCGSGEEVNETKNETIVENQDTSSTNVETENLPEVAELNLLNFSEYIPEQVIKNFETENNVKVNYNIYSSPQEMVEKVNQDTGKYDLVVATDYALDKLRKQNLLQGINFDNIQNMKNIDPQYLKKNFDPEGKYAVPFMWGNVVLLVNSEEIKTPITSYEDLWDNSFEKSIVVLDEPRVLMGMALKKLGYSANETDEKKIELANQELIKLKNNFVAFDSDSPKSSLIDGSAKIGLVWGGEASLASKEDPKFVTVYPKEGCILWQDNFVIPKDAKKYRTS